MTNTTITANQPNQILSAGEIHSDAPIYDLFIKPTYSVLLRQRQNRTKHKSIHQKKAELNLKDNKVKGELSKTSKTKLTNAVNWMSAAAPIKRIYDKSTGQTFQFKLNFITLTLPTTEHKITDEYFKKKMLHNFINTCRYKFNLKSYIWKVETQKNGNIHAHFTTDTFIHYKDLRQTWNRILERHNALQPYTDKHNKMTFQEYNERYNKDGKKPESKVMAAYMEGVKSNWKNPNTTDIKAVHKIKDIAAYLAKYLSKNDDERRKVKGRIWGCSYNLSQANNLKVEIYPGKNEDVLIQMQQKEIDWKPIEVKDKLSGKMKKIGELYLYKLDQWGKDIKGTMYDMFQEHLFFIRNSIDVLGLRSYSDTFAYTIATTSEQFTNERDRIEHYGDFTPTTIQTVCPF